MDIRYVRGYRHDMTLYSLVWGSLKARSNKKLSSLISVNELHPALFERLLSIFEVLQAFVEGMLTNMLYCNL